MPLQPASPRRAALLADQPSPIVVVPVYGAYDDVVCCLESIVAHSPAGTGVLVVDDAGADRRAIDLLQALAPTITQHVVVLHRDVNGGFVRSCNDAFAATPGRDVVVVNSDVVVGPEWLERLTAAARSTDTVATASARSPITARSCRCLAATSRHERCSTD